MSAGDAPLRCENLPDPWVRRADLATAAAEVSRVYEHLLTELSARLDSIHGEPFGARYWRILLGPWLLYHLQQLEDRRRRAELFLAAGKRDVILMDETDFQIPRDTPEFWALFQTGRYNLQLLSLVFRALGVSGRAVRVPAASSSDAERGPKEFLRGARRAAGGAARRLRPAEALTDGFDPLDRKRYARLAKAMDFRLWPLADRLPERLRVAAVLDARRRAFTELPAEGPLESLAVASLPWCLPALFLEGFSEARAYSRRILGRPPRLMVYSNGIYCDELYKLCAAEASRTGTILIGVQHGGQYGTALWSSPEKHERSIADRYFTWGWKEDATTLPAPVPWLSPPPPRSPHPADVLLVSTSGLRLPHELFPAPMGDQWKEFFDWRGRFLDALAPEDLSATRLRLSPHDLGWGERSEAAARWPGLRLAAGPLTASLASASLIVADHPGTIFFETLAWDIPGVHFWDARFWEQRPSADAAFEPLRRAGIVHADPESAARQVAAVRADAAAWWNAPATREARREFSARYARADPAWTSEWTRLLRDASARKS